MHWDQKSYHSLSYELTRQFGKKVYKLSLDGGMTCPNRTEPSETAAAFSAARADLVILLPPDAKAWKNRSGLPRRGCREKCPRTAHTLPTFNPIPTPTPPSPI